MTQDRVCPQCGTESWLFRDHERIVHEKLEIGSRFKSLRANHGLEKAQWELREISLTEEMKYLQRKVLKQAKAITTLENKLKRLKQQPYSDTLMVRLFNGEYVEVPLNE